MWRIQAYSHFGGRDLYYGVPNLEGAAVKEVKTEENEQYYITIIVLKRPDSEIDIEIVIKQEK